MYVLFFLFFLLFLFYKKGRRKLRLSKYLTFEERKRESARKKEREREIPLEYRYLQYIPKYLR